MTSKLVEGLAEAMFAMVHGSSMWATTGDTTQGRYRAYAGAALAHLNIPEKSGPVNVGEAVVALEEEICECAVSARPCGRCVALYHLGATRSVCSDTVRALGGEVD